MALGLEKGAPAGADALNLSVARICLVRYRSLGAGRRCGRVRALFVRVEERGPTENEDRDYPCQHKADD
jgi:hypothetical protein